jgi:hypothetical protein
MDLEHSWKQHAIEKNWLEKKVFSHNDNVI